MSKVREKREKGKRGKKKRGKMKRRKRKRRKRKKGMRKKGKGKRKGERAKGGKGKRRRRKKGKGGERERKESKNKMKKRKTRKKGRQRWLVLCPSFNRPADEESMGQSSRFLCPKHPEMGITLQVPGSRPGLLAAQCGNKPWLGLSLVGSRVCPGVRVPPE